MGLTGKEKGGGKAKLYGGIGVIWGGHKWGPKFQLGGWGEQGGEVSSLKINCQKKKKRGLSGKLRILLKEEEPSRVKRISQKKKDDEAKGGQKAPSTPSPRRKRDREGRLKL